MRNGKRKGEREIHLSSVVDSIYSQSSFLQYLQVEKKKT